MVFNETNYQLKTCTQLRDECKELKITGYSNKTKEGLISLLKKYFQNKEVVEQPEITDSDDMLMYNLLIMKDNKIMLFSLSFAY
jgi:hypothetical protein